MGKSDTLKTLRVIDCEYCADAETESPYECKNNNCEIKETIMLAVQLVTEKEQML